jgi:V/A-type H+-transporting ATPase subunit D
MDPTTFPTKGNLILAKNSLALAKQGYELMDKKRNILIREIMELVGEVKSIQEEIGETFETAYRSLEMANVELGVENVIDFSLSVLLKLLWISLFEVSWNRNTYCFSSIRFFPPGLFFPKYKRISGYCKRNFERVKELSIRLAMLENSAFRLAHNIRKAQKRANALQNITIPKYEQLVFNITNALEEKDREEFTRLKVIKRNKSK